MKTAILCFPYINNEKIQYPIGLFKIADYCKNKYNIEVIDGRMHKVFPLINKILKEKEVLCLGLSVMTGEQIKNAIYISKKYKNRIPIVWGGLHPSITPKQTIGNDYLDYIIIGEGEKAFLNLLQFIDKKKITEQLFLSKNNKNYNVNIFNDFSTIDYIDYNVVEINENYIIKRDGFSKAFNIETSRGCPFSCYFCHNSIYNNKYRILPTKVIIETIKKLLVKYKIDGIIFQEDNFFGNIERIKTIIKEIKKLNIGWKANSRINYFKSLINNKKFMKSLIDSNCKVLQFGIESGSQKIIKMINKKIEINDVIDINKKLSKYDIKIRYNFIVGFPYETINDIKGTINLIRQLQKENNNVLNPFLNIYTPYPGTKLYNMARKLGFNPPNSTIGWSNITWNKNILPWFDKKTNKYLIKQTNNYYKKSNYLK